MKSDWEVDPMLEYFEQVLCGFMVDENNDYNLILGEPILYGYKSIPPNFETFGIFLSFLSFLGNFVCGPKQVQYVKGNLTFIFHENF